MAAARFRLAPLPLVALGLVLLAAAPVAGQTLTFPADTVRTVAADSLRPDSLTVAPRPGDFTAPVSYSAADSLVFDLKTRTFTLYRDAVLRYTGLELSADHVTVDLDRQTLSAEGGVNDSGKTVGAPIFNEGGQVYTSERLVYNLRTRQAGVSGGRTALDQGYYRGEHIRLVGQQTIHVESGTYTTCDLDHPHYHFYGKEMKVLVRDKVIARPVVFFIADVPVFALPFAVFPNRSGNASGILPPTYGESSRGRFLRGMGYYAKVSDYIDGKGTLDWYSRGGYTLDGLVRYSRRYKFNGQLSAGYTRDRSGLAEDRQYRLPGATDGYAYRIAWQHSQPIDPTLSVNANLDYLSSGSYFRQTQVLNLASQTNADLTSSAALQKRWEGTPFSLSASYNRRQNLFTDAFTEARPSLTLTQQPVFPFARKGRVGTPAWYEKLGWSYSGQLLNNLSRQLALDATGNRLAGQFITTDSRGILHTVTPQFSTQFRYVTLYPSANYQERWYRERETITLDTADSTATPVTSSEKGFFRVPTYSLGVNASTRLYGTVQRSTGYVRALRHTFEPTLGYSYAPDFSTNGDIFGAYRTRSGALVRYNRFGRQPYSGVSQGESQSVVFGLNNTFEAKVARRDTSSDAVNGVRLDKVRLLDLRVNSSYNFVADSLRLAPVQLSAATQRGDNFRLTADASLDPYDRVQLVDPRTGTLLDAYGRTNTFYAARTGRPFRLNAVNLGASLSFRGDKKKPAAGRLRYDDTDPALNSQLSTAAGRSVLDTGNPTVDYDIPYDLNARYALSANYDQPGQARIISTLSGDLSVSLTPNWKVQSSASYDFDRGDIALWQVNLYRDLHCWEMTFNWVPVGPYRQYGFEIRLKAPQLRDIKVTRTGASTAPL